MQREPMNTSSSITTGFACGGSSTPPIPTPPGEVHALADLRARADRRPRVDHRAVVDVGTDVHVRRHEHDAVAEVAAEPRLRAGNDAHARRAVVVLQREPVDVLERPDLDRLELAARGTSSSTACFAHSCTTTSPSITSATRASPRSSSPIARVHRVVGLRRGQHRLEVGAGLPELRDRRRQRSGRSSQSRPSRVGRARARGARRGCTSASRA